MAGSRKSGSRSSAVSRVLNVLGMAAAFASVFIILVQLRYDFGYNRKIRDAERVYVISVPDWYEEGKYMTWLSRPIWEDVIANVPCVESGGTGYTRNHGNSLQYSLSESGDGAFLLHTTSFSQGLITALGMEAVEGDFKTMGKGGIAVSARAARAHDLRIGDVLYCNSVNPKRQDEIVAIYADLPENSDFGGLDCLYDMGDVSLDNFSEWSYPYFVKLRNSDDKQAFEEEAVKRIKETFLSEGDDASAITPKLFCLTDTYFDHSVGTPGRSGSRTSTMTLLAIAVLVTLIAFINFINFFFALVPVKLKGVNTRKILGASRATLALGTVGESVALICVALLLSAGIVSLFASSPIAGQFSSSIALADNIGTALITAAAAIVLAALTSLYPAFYITSFNPAFALKGSFGSSSKGKVFRTGLVGFQFVVSIALIISSCFVSMQRKYMMSRDMGFDKSQLLQVYTTNALATQRDAVGDRLKSDPRILDVTWADGEIVQSGRMGWGRQFKGEQVNFKCYPVAWNFLDFMGIELVEGRNFTPSDEICENGVFIFNEAARDKFGLTLEDKMQGHIGETDIAGICRNFNNRSLALEVEPFALYVFGKNGWRVPTCLYLRTAPDVDYPSLFSWIKGVLSEMDPNSSENDFDVNFFDDRLDRQYTAEKNTSRMVTLFTLLAIIISLMGVFGLVMFEAEHRRKEIGVRRVSGASIADVLKMFNAKFIRIVLVCFLIAAPLSWFIMNRYLQHFAYRMPLHWWVFALALVFVLLVTVLVVTLRCYRAATSDPVECLRSE